MTTYRLQFRIWPVEKKVRYYNDLAEIANDFTEQEAKDASIDVIYKGVIVGTLLTSAVIAEIY